MKLFLSFLVLSMLAAKSLSAEQEVQDDSVKTLELQTRIVNGKNANKHEWPWQVSIRYRGRHICGGSLITKNWVISAAHCFKKGRPVSSYTVVVGAHRLFRNGFNRYRKTFKARRIILHISYQKGGRFRYDIALVQLHGFVKLSKGVKTIRLPPNGSRAKTGKTCYATGWGASVHPKRATNILQEAPLRIGSDRSCRLLNGFNFHARSMVCAGAQGKGICFGDSGGPLSCREKGRWILRGVSSWVKTGGHSAGCHPRRYSVFARVSSFIAWIKKIIGGKGNNPCRNYKILNARNRARGVPRGNVLKCDKNDIMNGKWYRFKGLAGSAMPTSPVPINRCGTHAPGWMIGFHPLVSNGIVVRRVCFNWNRNRCQWTRLIRVRNCGRFYVYQLFKPPTCWLRYCGNGRNKPLCPRIHCFYGRRYCRRGRSYCRCNKGYTGRYCSIRKRKCRWMFCYYGGKRYCRRGRPYCRCPRRTYGRQCQFRKRKCRPMLCYYGGKRYCRGSRPYCRCPRRTYGRQCQFRRWWKI